MDRRLRHIVALCVVVFCAHTAPAQEPRAESNPSLARIQALESKVEALSEELQAVRAELAALKKQQQEAAQKARLEELKRQALAEAGGTAPKLGVEPEKRFVSGTRMQPQLNPEISVTGNMFLVGGNHQREEAQAREFELDVQSYLDPYAKMHLVVSHTLPTHRSSFGLPPGTDTSDEGGTEVEEGYITWLGLPGGTTLTVGKKRQQFGILNRWHLHALDQTDLPWVVAESFGDEGLSGTGLSVDWTMPKLWADANRLTFEITDGDNDVAFAGGDWQHPSFLARLGSYWDLTDNAYFELGLNALHGSADPEGHRNHDFYAADLTYNWYPAGREQYRDLTLRGMLLRSELDLPGGEERDAWGGFLYGQLKFARRWIAGLRWDRLEDQREEGHRYWGLSPYLTFWQSEFVRLRAQASYRDDNRFGIDRRFEFQITFAAGPHKHEQY